MYLGQLSTPFSDASSTAAGSKTVPCVQAAPIGTTVMLIVATNALSTQDGSFTVTDNATGGGAANTWTERAHAFKSGTVQMSVLTCTLTRALTTAHSFTISHPAVNVIDWCVQTHAWDDLTAFDVAIAANGASNAPASGPTAPGAQANELTFVATAWGSTPTITDPGRWTSGPTTSAIGTSQKNLEVHWQYTTTGGARSGSASLSASVAWCQATVVFKSGSPPQILVPVADVNASGWVQTGGTPGNAYSCINSGATPDDTSYLTSPNNPSAQPLEMLMAAGSAPIDLTGDKLRVRARLNGSTGNLLLRVKQGSTTIATLTSTPLTAGAIQWYEFDLSTVQAAAISGYGTLHGYLEVTAS